MSEESNPAGNPGKKLHENKDRGTTNKGARASKRPKLARKLDQSDREVVVKIDPWGPDQATVDALSGDLLRHPSVRTYLEGTRNRLLYVELFDSKAEAKTGRRTSGEGPPDRFQATIYDYTNNRTIRAVGSLADQQSLEVSDFGDQPLPTTEEFEEAVERLMEEPDIGPALRNEHLRPYPPMPPLIEIEAEQADGRIERTIAVGLLPTGGERQARHEIVGVNMVRQTVVRFERNAPDRSEALNSTCGIPYRQQTTTGRAYVAGQVWITVTQGGAVLWRFLVVRPAATKGPGSSTNGTGVELRFVDYRGKRVLYRAHVPILNVKYNPGGCGPYRDWQNEEGMIQASGTDVAPGFRLCPAPATTILDNGSDMGNFLGVAIYVQGQEVVLVSEMEAGWYRYVSEWRLHTNGTIRPRFGFGAVQSSCVCTAHHHHVYWRLDFDIRTAGNNVVREFNDPPLFPPSNWHDKSYEIRRPRDPARNRKWRVENASTGEGYEIIPGPDDGVATLSVDWPFPRGDVWILRYHGSEIDDGVVATGPPYEANLDSFINGESISKQDVVIWYAGHVTHDIGADPPGTFGHIIGPELTPVNW